jgi:uncharacterized protein YdeI (YjbR/CyaY-like superfamily)
MSERTDSPRRAAYLAAAEPWEDVLAELRRILLGCGLTEEVKWGAPCFMADGGNVAILGPMRDSCVLSFFKGVLLSDPEGVLEAPGANSRSARFIRFTDVAGVRAMEPVVIAYVDEAAGLERAGAKVDFGKDRDEVAVPAELAAALDGDPAFAAAFAALTPGRRRGWLIHFSGGKQPATRTSRIEKAKPRILDGKGMHDR